jgi:hypothetical protein
MTVNGVDIAFCDGESGDGEPVSITIDACPEPLPSDERFATAEAAAMRQSRAPLRTVLPVGDWEVVATYEFVDVVARKRDA